MESIRQIDEIIEVISARHSNLNQIEESKEIEEVIKSLIGVLSSIKDKGKGFNSM